MDIKEAKSYFQLGVVAGIEVKKVGDWLPMCSKPGWVVLFHLKGGDTRTVHTARNEPKVYVSLDTVAVQLEEITGRVSGFSVVV